MTLYWIRKRKSLVSIFNISGATQFPNQSARLVNARRSGFIRIATLSGNNFLLILTPRHYHDTTLDLSQVIVWHAWTTLGINLLVDIFSSRPHDTTTTSPSIYHKLSCDKHRTSGTNHQYVTTIEYKTT